MYGIVFLYNCFPFTQGQLHLSYQKHCFTLTLLLRNLDRPPTQRMDPLYSLAVVIPCWDEDFVQSCSVPVTYLWTLQATDCFRSCVKITLVGDGPGFLFEHGRVKAICRQKSLVTQS